MKNIFKYAIPAILVGLAFSVSVFAQVAPANFWKLSSNVLSPISSAWSLAFKTLDKGGTVFNASAYGVKADGSTDDTSALQTAMNTSVGGTLVLPCGTTIKTTAALVLKSFMHIQACGGQGSTTIKLANSANTSTFTSQASGLDDVSLSGFTVDGNGANQSAGTSTIYITGSDTLLRNVRITSMVVENCWRHCIFVTGDNTSNRYLKTIQNNFILNHGVGAVGYGIYTDYAPNTLISGNTIKTSNGNDAIEAGHLGEVQIVNNYLYDGPIQFPFASNSLIAGNILKSGVIQNDANTATNVVITGNQVLGATPAAGYAGISAYGNGDIITNNYVKVSTSSGIRFYSASYGTISNNYIDGTSSSTGGTNGVYLDNSSNTSVFGNEISNFARGVEIVLDNNIVSYNTVTNASTGIDIVDSSGSGHVAVGNQIYFNNVNGNPNPFTPHNQTSYALINASGSAMGVNTMSPIGAWDVYGTDSLSTNGLAVELGVYNTGAAQINRGAYIGLGGQSGVGTTTFGAIIGAKENATGGNTSGYLGFYTRLDGSALTTERMRLTSDGKLGVGTNGSKPSGTAQFIDTINNSSTLLIGASSTKSGCFEAGAASGTIGKIIFFYFDSNAAIFTTTTKPAFCM